MTILIVLAGQHADNAEWSQNIESEIKKFNLFSQVFVQKYSNWFKEDKRLIDFDFEFLNLKENISSFNKYCILAKSVGSLLALYSIYRDVLNPEKCVLIGIPVNWAKKMQNKERFVAFKSDGSLFYRGVESWFDNYSLPTLFVQQKKDPTMNSKNLNDLLDKKGVFKNSQTRFLEIDGWDHKYDNADYIAKWACDFFCEK